MCVGVGIVDALCVVLVVVEAGVVVVVMLYWNSIEHYGVVWFVVDLAVVGGSGVITFDFILEEVEFWLVVID